MKEKKNYGALYLRVFGALLLVMSAAVVGWLNKELTAMFLALTLGYWMGFDCA